MHIDFAEKGEHTYLIVVDSHIKWLEVIRMKTTTSEKTIDVLSKLFSSHGLCEEMVSDNRPQLMSYVFKSFCEANGVKHIKVVPYQPQSHGNSHEHWLAHFLLRYRCTPIRVTPCQLFLKRNLRNKFSLLKPSLEREMEEKQRNNKEGVKM